MELQQFITGQGWWKVEKMQSKEEEKREDKYDIESNQVYIHWSILEAYLKKHYSMQQALK